MTAMVMECLVTIGGEILGTIFGYTVVAVRHQLEYLFSYNGNIEYLEKQIRELDGTINMIQRRADRALQKGDNIEGHVQDWQRDVTTKSEEAKRFLEDDPDHTRAKCSCRWPS